MKKFLLMILTVILIFPLAMNAQQIVDIGLGGTSTSSYLPLYSFYNNTLSEQIYTASEIGMPGTITSIAFYNAGSTKSPNLKIYMINTNRTDFSSTTDWLPVTAGDLVYDGSNVSLTAGAWTTIQFDTPFSYDGVSNLGLIVDANMSWSSGLSCYVFSSTSNCSMYVYSDGTDYNAVGATYTASSRLSTKNQIKLGIIPGAVNCHAVGALNVSNISAFDANIIWGASEDPGTQILQYKTSTMSWEDNDVVTDYPTDTTYSFSGQLTPTTTYNVRVANMCAGGDTSVWRNTTFRTGCAPVDSLPYVENFDTYGTGGAANYPECWNKLSTYTSGTTPYISSTNYQGVGSLYFYVGSASQYNMAIMHEIDATIPINTLQVSFAYRASNATDRLIVGIIDDITDGTTFTPIDTVYPVVGNASAWDERVVTFDQYTGTGNHIAFKNEYTSTYCYAYIDNVTVDLISTCAKPTDVSITNYTTEGADINWVPAGNESAWEVVAVPAGQDVNTGTPEPTTTYPYTLTNLQDNTTYDVYVRADCGSGEYSGWTFKRTFKTNPECSVPLNVTVSQISTNSALVSWDPAVFGASNYTVGYSEAGQNNWTVQVVNGTQYMISGLTLNTSYNVYVGSNCAAGHADSVTVAFTTRSCLVGGDLQIGDGTSTSSYLPEYATYNYSYTQQIYLASEMNGQAAINSISFDAESIATANRHLKIYLMHTSAAGSSWLDASSAQLVCDTTINLTTGWNTFNFTAPFQYNGIDNLAVIVIDATGSWSSSNSFYCHTTSQSLAQYNYQDNTPYSITSLPTSDGYGGTTTSRNNVIFGVPCDSTTTCAAPNLYVTSTTDNSVTVAWTPGNLETSWELEYSTEADTTWISAGSVTSPYTITGQSSNMNVYVRVRANCGGGETSTWAVTSARTDCSIVNTLPLTENFDNAPGSGAGNMVDCWSTLTNYSSSYPYTSSSYANSGTYSAYFYGTSAYFSYLISPEFDPSIALNTLQVRFWAYKTSIPYYIQVGVMTDPSDYSTFTQLSGNMTPSTTGSWEMLDVNLDEYNGTGHYIAFRIPQSYASYMYVDDIAIDIIPTCAHVDSLQVSNMQATGATFTWVPGGSESAWDVAIVPGTDEVDLDTVNHISVSGSPTLTVNDLNQNTIYTVYVRANCGFEQSFWMNAEFMTTQIPATLPFSCDFEDTTEAAMFACVNGTQPHKWVVGTATNNGGTHALYISNDNGASNSYAIGSASSAWAYRDVEFPANPSGYTLTFDWRSYGESCCDYMRVFVGDPTPVTAGNYNQPAGSTDMMPNYNTSYPNYFNTASTYQTFTTTLPGMTETTVKRIYFLWRNDGSIGTMPPASVDNISIAAINCDAPTALTVDSITATTAEVSWTTTAVTSVILYKGDNDADWTEVTSVTSPYTLTNLSANTHYMVRVANICDDGVNISPYVTTSFYTACAAISTLPYTENFDNYTASTSTRPNCWSFPVTYSDAPYITSNYYSSSPNSLYFQSETTNPTTAVSPQFDVDIHTLRVKFMLKAESTTSSGTFEIGVMSDPANVSTFESVRIIQPANTSWNQYVVDFDSTTLSGPGQYIAFRQNSNSSVWYYWLDNVMVMNIPTCPEPDNLISTANTSTSITIDWTPNGGESAWNIMYGVTGFDPANGTVVPVTTHPYEVPNLETDSTYDFYVQADCGGGDESIWVGPYTLKPGTYIMPTTGNNTLTTCDMVIYDDGGLTGDYASNCESYLTINPTDASNLIAIQGTLSTESCCDHLYIYDGASASGTLLGQYEGTGVTIPQLVSTTGPITLHFHSDGSLVNSGFVLTVSCIPNTCPMPTGLTVSNVGSTSADLSWTAGGTENSWAVEYKEASASTWITGVATTTSYQLTGLNALTAYDVRVKADCGGGDESAYVTTSFTTIEGTTTCNAPTGLAVNNVTTNTATASWTAGGTENSWNVQYKAASASNWQSATANATSYTMTGLTPNTAYQVRVQANCGAGNTSDWTTAVSFTTNQEQQTCPAPTNLTATIDATSHTTVVLTWQQEANTANEWQVNYRISTESTWSTATATSTTYTLTDLTPNVDYVANVVAHCTNGLNSDESNTVTFHTDDVGITNYLEKAVSLYPNPATEMISVEVSDANIMITGVEVYNVYGQLINTIVSTENPLRINISGLADGMYYVRVTTDGGVVTKNFVKK